jgi:membrane protein required for colicin V production
MNSLDLFFLVIIIIFFLRGLFRGLAFELISLIGLILGYLIAITYLNILSALILKYIPALPTAAANIISFAIIFIITNIILRFVANVLTRTLKYAMLGWLNRLLGGLFGIMKSLIVLSIIVFLISLVPALDGILKMFGLGDSFIFPLLKILGPELYEQIQNLAKQI